MSDVNERTIISGGSEVHYLEAGDNGGRDILLLHGMKFQAETWRGLGTLEFLAAKGFHALALDLPGFGKSAASGVKPAEVLRTMIDELSLERSVIIGPSMGGRIALEFTLDNKELVGALILVGSVGVEENLSRLVEIRVPVLAVWGEKDSISPLDNGRLLAREVADCRLVVIEGAPHPCYLDHGPRFHREINEFLRALP